MLPHGGLDFELEFVRDFMMKGWRKNRLFSALALVAICAILLAIPTWNPPGLGAENGGGADPVYYFTGRGRAHGVGLCMDGVMYRALDGYSYRDIISYYYTGINFSLVDDNMPIRVKCRDGIVRVYPLHQYLYHLQEEPESYPFEGLKVLYVAARTYAISCIQRGKHAKDGYDICSSGNCCQAFDENKDLSRYPNNCRAVDATTGEVITYNGKIITAAYCGSCGGHTENNEDVWGGTPLPYLRGKPDTYCSRSSRYSWNVELRRSDIEARLNSRSDTAIGTLQTMDLSDRTPGGRVRNARLVGSAGTKYVSGSILAGILGCQSTLFFLLRGNFDTYILLSNPNPTPSLVTFSFMEPDGTMTNEIAEVGANSRYTMLVNDYLQFREFSTRVVSDGPVVAERAMYFNFLGGTRGGSASSGVVKLSPKWYFAEGYTGGSFDTYFLVQNPEPSEAQVKFTFMPEAGQPNVECALAIPPYSRITLHADDVPGLENASFSTVVECTSGEGIVAERSSYFNYFGIGGGHSAPGIVEPAEKWYMAEGYTGLGFDTYILLANPGEETLKVKADFLREDGVNVKKTYSIPPRSRYTIYANRVEGLGPCGFSTTLTSASGDGFIAERAMYFDYLATGSMLGGGASVASSETSENWYFAEGYTGGNFDTYILLSNPNERNAEVKVLFQKPDGVVLEKHFTVRAKSRFTISLDAIEGLSSSEASTTISSTNGVGIVAERSMYFIYSDGYSTRDGGHSSLGATSPGSTWYFSEGYTGF